MSGPAECRDAYAGGLTPVPHVYRGGPIWRGSESSPGFTRAIQNELGEQHYPVRIGRV